MYAEGREQQVSGVGSLKRGAPFLARRRMMAVLSEEALLQAGERQKTRELLMKHTVSNRLPVDDCGMG